MTGITVCAPSKNSIRAGNTRLSLSPRITHQIELLDEKGRALCPRHEIANCEVKAHTHFPLLCDACLRAMCCYPPHWSIPQLAEFPSSRAVLTVAMRCNSATRESGAGSHATTEALASGTSASPAQHSSATAAAAASPFPMASAAASTPTSNSASFLPFASDCFALFALLSFAETNQPGASRPEHSASFATSRSRTASFTIGQTGLCRLETDFLKAATDVLLPSAMV